MTDISISSVKMGLFVRWQIANGHIFPFPPFRISVVLLDTTSVLGELGWKTYPINGVRRATLLLIIFTVQCSKYMAIAAFIKIYYTDVKRSKRVAVICFIFTSLFLFRPLFPHWKYYNLEADNEPWSLRKLPLCCSVFPYEFLSCLCLICVNLGLQKYSTHSLNVSQRKAHRLVVSPDHTYKTQYCS